MRSQQRRPRRRQSGGRPLRTGRRSDLGGRAFPGRAVLASRRTWSRRWPASAQPSPRPLLPRPPRTRSTASGSLFQDEVLRTAPPRRSTSTTANSVPADCTILPVGSTTVSYLRRTTHQSYSSERSRLWMAAAAYRCSWRMRHSAGKLMDRYSNRCRNVLLKRVNRLTHFAS